MNKNNNTKKIRSSTHTHFVTSQSTVVKQLKTTTERYQQTNINTYLFL